MEMSERERERVVLYQVSDLSPLFMTVSFSLSLLFLNLDSTFFFFEKEFVDKITKIEKEYQFFTPLRTLNKNNVSYK